MGCDHSKLESFGRNSQAYYSKLKRFGNDPQACCYRALKRYGKKLSRRWPYTETRSVDVQFNPSADEHDHNHDFHDDDEGEDFFHDQTTCNDFGVVDKDVPKSDGGVWYQGGHEEQHHNISRPHTSLDKGKGIMADDEQQPRNNNPSSWHCPKAEYFSHTCDKSKPNSYYHHHHHPQHEEFVHSPFQKSSPAAFCNSQPRDYHEHPGRKGGFSYNTEHNHDYNYHNLYYPGQHSSGQEGTTYNWICHVPHNDSYCDDHHHRRVHLPNSYTYDQSWTHDHPTGQQSAKPQHHLSWDNLFGHDPIEQFFAPSFYFN